MATTEYLIAWGGQEDMDGATVATIQPDATADIRDASPRCKIRLQYLAEGAANVVFKIVVPTSDLDSSKNSNIPINLDSKLLRVHKRADPNFDSKGNQDPSTSIVGHIASFVNKELTPHLPNLCINHAIVSLHPSTFPHLNEALEQAEQTGLRPTRRHGAYISAQQTYALLIDDLSPRTPAEVTLHFKPKWLSQSPTAPSAARRCRTCAKQASEGIGATTAHCPLRLVRGDIENVTHSVDAVLPSRQGVHPSLREALLRFFLVGGAGHELLLRLARLQREWDVNGILAVRDDAIRAAAAEGVEVELRHWMPGLAAVSRAMSVRDCSLFLRCSRLEEEDDIGNGDGGWDIEAKLVDLDPKAMSKAPGWAELEEGLIRGGFYAGTEVIIEGADIHTECLLWSSIQDG